MTKRSLLWKRAYTEEIKKNRRNFRRSGFESPYPVAVSQIGPNEWELTAPLRYRTGDGFVYEVPPEQTTDFASVPSVLTWLVPSSTGIAAAVLHDYLWRELAAAGKMDYRDADTILRRALRHLGVSRTRAWTMWAAVRWGALFSRRGGHVGFWRDAPAVLAISVPLLALVLPVGAVLLPAWVVYKIVEYVIG